MEEPLSAPIVQDMPSRSGVRMRIRFLPALLFLSVALFLTGYQLGQGGVSLGSFGSKGTSYSSTPPAQAINTSGELDLAHFWRVWNLIHSDHIDKASLDDQKLLYGAIEGMVASIGDPYTAYLPPEKNTQFKESLSGSYEGIGAELGMLEEQLIIVSPIEGSPAEAAGVLPQDAIVKINGEDTRGVSIPEAVGKIRGKAGTEVTLTLARRDEPDSFDLTLTRAQIQLKSVKEDRERLAQGEGEEKKRFEEMSEGVAYVRLSRFGDNTKEEWDKTVQDVLTNTKPLKAVILDLRNNPGGYLGVSIDLAGDFLKKGTAVVQEEESSGKKQAFTAKGQERFLTVPIVVLINEGSASASEILAAALKENRPDTVTLVGKKSFGKGTIQEKKDLEDGSGVNITIAKWLTAKGVWVHKQGVAVDVEVELTRDDITAKRDTQLMKAIEIAQQ